MNGLLATLAFIGNPYSSRYYFSVVRKIPDFDNLGIMILLGFYECVKAMNIVQTQVYPTLILAMYFYQTSTFMTRLR